MAGAILIGERRAVSMSGLAFDRILGAIRSIIRPRDETLANRICESVDEGGMDFISVGDVDSADYVVFYESVRDAYAQELEVNPNAPFKAVWEELIVMLSTDTRAPVIV